MKLKLKRTYCVNFFDEGILKHKYFTNCIRAFEFASECSLQSVEIFISEVYEEK